MELNRKKIINYGFEIINALVLIILGLNAFTDISIPEPILITTLCLWVIGFIYKLTKWKENTKEDNILNIIVFLFLVGGIIWIMLGE